LEQRLLFYKKYLNEFVHDKNATILVVAGSSNDAKILHLLGYSNVLITNITQTPEKDISPYTYQFADAMNLPFQDNSFDYTLVVAALHHLSSPHKGLTELYRVAKKAALVLEANDNFLMRCMTRWKIAEDFELSAVNRKDNQAGGVNNTGIPNYIYRWTDRELMKTIQSYQPTNKIKIEIKKGLTMPYTFELADKWLYKIIYKILKFILVFFPSQRNLFFAKIYKQ
jgi:ubiquinone/menaquinone biosynthesis C-methylase UbiE